MVTAVGKDRERQRNVETFTRAYDRSRFACVVFMHAAVDATTVSLPPHCFLVQRNGSMVEYQRLITCACCARTRPRAIGGVHGAETPLVSLPPPTHAPLPPTSFVATERPCSSPEYLAHEGLSGVVLHGAGVTPEPGFDALSLFDFAAAHRLDVASPILAGSWWVAAMSARDAARLLPRPAPANSTWGRLVSFLEVGQLTAFTFEGWACWWSLLDPELNSLGFGYDDCFYSLCRLRMGVMESGPGAAAMPGADPALLPDAGAAQAQEAGWKAARWEGATFFAAPCDPFRRQGEPLASANATLGLLPPRPVGRRRR